MKRILTLSLFTFHFSLSAIAVPSFWAAVETGAAKSDKSAGGNLSSYSAYYCTKDVADLLFGDGINTVKAVTTYLSSNFDAGKSALEDSVTFGDKKPEVITASDAAALTTCWYDSDGYVFKNAYGESLATLGSEFLAVLIYENGEDQEFRVMANEGYDIANGNAQFSDNPLVSSADVGDWTTVVPEPTGALLLLLGLAGLALRRKTVAGQSKCNCRQVKCNGLVQLAFNMPHSHSQSCSF